MPREGEKGRKGSALGSSAQMPEGSNFCPPPVGGGVGADVAVGWIPEWAVD